MNYNFIKFFQITNGDSKLSQELSQLFSDYYDCTVVLLSPPNYNTSSANSFTCDLSSNVNVRSVVDSVWDTFDGVDIVINNERTNSTSKINSPDVEGFVLNSGNNIQQYINVSNVKTSSNSEFTKNNTKVHRSNFCVVLYLDTCCRERETKSDKR